jgi:hypothetical protein
MEHPGLSRLRIMVGDHIMGVRDSRAVRAGLRKESQWGSRRC